MCVCDSAVSLESIYRAKFLWGKFFCGFQQKSVKFLETIKILCEKMWGWTTIQVFPHNTPHKLLSLYVCVHTVHAQQHETLTDGWTYIHMNTYKLAVDDDGDLS